MVESGPQKAKYGFFFSKKANEDIYLTPEGEQKYTIVWMHGLGDSSEGFLDFFYSDDSILPHKKVKVVLLNAPSQRVTINRGMEMNSWFDITALGETLSVNEDQIATSTARVTQVLEEEAKALGGDYSKVFIGGFSQGCLMSLNIAILAPFRVGGLVGLSGAAFESLLQKVKDDKEGRFEDKKKNLPLFLYHGVNDPTIMHHIADSTYKQMKELGFEKMEYQSQKGMGHSVSMQEIGHIKEFLKRMMP